MSGRTPNRASRRARAARAAIAGCLLAGTLLLAPASAAAATATGDANPQLVVRRDIAFATVGEVTLRLDVWHRRDARRGRPVALLVHGGGWRSGDKREWEQRRWAQRLAMHGWLVISPNYRLACGSSRVRGRTGRRAAPTPFEKVIRPSDKALCGFRMQQSLMDVRTALNFVGTRANRWRGDRTRIVVIGASAGAQLAMLTTSERRRPRGIVAVVGISTPTDLGAIGANPGATLVPTLEQSIGCTFATCARTWRWLSPRNRVVRGITPPTYVFTSERDVVTPASFAKAYVTALSRRSIPAHFAAPRNPRSGCHGPYTCNDGWMAGTRRTLFADIQWWLEPYRTGQLRWTVRP